MLSLIVAEVQRIPPRGPSRAMSSGVQGRVYALLLLPVWSTSLLVSASPSGTQTSAKQICDSWWKPAVTRRETRTYFGAPGLLEDQCGSGMMAGLKKRASLSRELPGGVSVMLYRIFGRRMWFMMLLNVADVEFFWKDAMSG